MGVTWIMVHHRLVARLVVLAAGAAVFALSACSSSSDKASPTSSSAPQSTASSAAAAAAPDHPLPDPAALTDVLNRLADPNLPGAEKVTAVQGATPEQLDKFTKAIGDAGFSPLSFTVKDPKWSTETPGDVEAVVTINSPSPKMGGFAVPMSFSPEGEGWKLSKRTSDLLLKTGTSLAGTGTRRRRRPPTPLARRHRHLPRS
ncbi:putative lipoprotein lppK [Mycobacteroides abscessus 21]|uniref:Putative lipoprotein lppK n=1 Tax=Mycobacteroides abscessus 21 TaxID=1299324 RepID=A0A829Q3R2_9MYCO|nr:putative lipoprotein lppK [Mycobacteroides abscessus 21]